MKESMRSSTIVMIRTTVVPFVPALMREEGEIIFVRT